MSTTDSVVITSLLMDSILNTEPRILWISRGVSKRSGNDQKRIEYVHYYMGVFTLFHFFDNVTSLATLFAGRITSFRVNSEPVSKVNVSFTQSPIIIYTYRNFIFIRYKQQSHNRVNLHLNKNYYTCSFSEQRLHLSRFCACLFLLKTEIKLNSTDKRNSNDHVDRNDWMNQFSYGAELKMCLLHSSS